MALDVVSEFAQSRNDILVRDVHLSRKLVYANTIVHSDASSLLSILACFFAICAHAGDIVNKLFFKRKPHRTCIRDAFDLSSFEGVFQSATLESLSDAGFQPAQVG
jgi:hypothetical protein